MLRATRASGPIELVVDKIIHEAQSFIELTVFAQGIDA